MQVGAAIVASRFVVAEVPPLTLAMLRYAIGFLCLLPFALRALRGVPVPRTRDLLAMATLGIGQFGILIALLNWGLRTVPAAPAALIFGLFPLLTLLMAAALGREQVTPRLAAGVLLSIAGVALSLAPKLQAAGVASGWAGEGAVFAAACVGALCSVLYRPYLRRHPTVPVSAFAMLASVLLLAAIALREDWPHQIRSFTATAWVVVAFIGVSSGVGYFWWLYALKHESPTRVTVFLALNPVTAAFLARVLLGEPLPAQTWGALALIAAGLWLATHAASGKRQPAPG